MPTFGTIRADEQIELTPYDGNPSTIIQSPTHRFITDAERTSWNGRVQDNDPRLSDSRNPLAHNHPASEITESATRRFITDTERTTWNSKQDALGFTPVPTTRTVNGQALSSNVTVSKSDVGLSNVPNVDTTNPSNIVQSSNFRFVTDAEKSQWNSAGSPSRVVLSADVTNSNAVANTLADVTGLSFPVTANNTYWFRFLIHYTSAATTTGSRWSINGPANSMLRYRSDYSLTATSRTMNEGLTTYNVPAASNASSLTAGNIAQIEGFITPTANGNVIARFASEIANSAIVARAKSFVEYQIV